MAWRIGATSWTRTAAAPASALATTVAAVPPSAPEPEPEPEPELPHVEAPEVDDYDALIDQGD